MGPDRAEQLTQIVRESADTVGAKWALIGGLAMQWYGSPKLTRSCDVISSRDLTFDALRRIKPIPSGGTLWRDPDGFDLSVRVRSDGYRALYEGALGEAVEKDGLWIVRPEWLAAMKFACIGDGHTLDLHWILRRESLGLVDVKRVEEIVNACLGGLFAKKSFRRTMDQVSASLKLEPSLDRCEYP